MSDGVEISAAVTCLEDLVLYCHYEPECSHTERDPDAQVESLGQILFLLQLLLLVESILIELIDDIRALNQRVADWACQQNSQEVEVFEDGRVSG